MLFTLWPHSNPRAIMFTVKGLCAKRMQIYFVMYLCLTHRLMSSGNDTTSAAEIAACVSECGVVNCEDFTINSQDALVSHIPCGEPVCYISGL